MSYALARAFEPEGRLSDFDVQIFTKALTAGGQSKDAMMASLIEIANTAYNRMRGSYNAYGGGTDDTPPGYQMSWPMFLSGHNAGFIERGSNYPRVDPATGETYTFSSFGFQKSVRDLEGKQTIIWQPIIEWRVK
jgi:hypothetical protein